MMRRIMHSITTTGNRYASCSGTPAMRCTSWWAPAAVAAASAAAYAASCLTSDTLNVQCESVKKNNAGTKYGDIHPPREVRTESSMLLLSDIDGENLATCNVTVPHAHISLSFCYTPLLFSHPHPSLPSFLLWSWV